MLSRSLPFKEPRQVILKTPTPFREMHNLEKKLGRDDLYIKRDDHMEIALGGNKIRSLEFWLGAAIEACADTILVAGGPMSNLCRLTASVAAMHGLDCIVFHNCEASPDAHQMSFLNKVFGAEIRYLGNITEEQRAKAVNDAAKELHAQGRTPYIVGDAIIGALGYAVAAYELHEQAQTARIDLRHVFLSGSMGPTEAGFIFGNALLGNPFTIHLVSVEYGQAELVARVARIYDGLAAMTRLSVPVIGDLPIHYHMDYLGSGYGQPTPEAEQALLMLAREEGILTEYVYTAKTLAGFIDLTTNGHITGHEAACFLHTGGVPSLFSQFNKFQTLD